jgi:6-phosphogluconolactonase (cycloisomerase 2 family)
VADFNSSLSVLSLSPETDQPSAIQQFGIAFNAQALAVDSSGAHLYVAGYDGEFQAYSVDTSTGRIQAAIGRQLTVPDSPTCVIAR